ncbi:hypothetical protein HDZ31DRAFT_76117 [Schizophyllum fasciatum]
MSFDSYTLASSRQTSLSAAPELAYAQIIVDLKAQVESLQTTLAEEQAKSRQLAQENAVLQARSTSTSTASQGGSESASAGPGGTRTSNASLRHLDPHVLAAECDIRPFACRVAFGREPWTDRSFLVRVVSAENATLLAAHSTGFRPQWLVGDKKLTVDHALFDDQVHILATSTRYNTVHSIKGHAARVLSHHNLPPELFSDDESKEALRQSPQVGYLLGRKSGSAKISLQPRVLFGCVDGFVEEIPFGNKGIVRTLQMIMYGEKSLDKPKKKSVARGSCAYKWALSRVTPGMIAWAAILIIYALSGDPELSHVGSYSGFEYRTNYRIYYGLLETTWNESKTRALVDYIDRELFSCLPLYARDSREFVNDIAEDDHGDLIAAMQGRSVSISPAGVHDEMAALVETPGVAGTEDHSECEEEHLDRQGASFPALAVACPEPSNGGYSGTSNLSVSPPIPIPSGSNTTNEGAGSNHGDALRDARMTGKAVEANGDKKGAGKGKGKGRGASTKETKCRSAKGVDSEPVRRTTRRTATGKSS